MRVREGSVKRLVPRFLACVPALIIKGLLEEGHISKGQIMNLSVRCLVVM